MSCIKLKFLCQNHGLLHLLLDKSQAFPNSTTNEKKTQIYHWSDSNYWPPKLEFTGRYIDKTFDYENNVL